MTEKRSQNPNLVFRLMEDYYDGFINREEYRSELKKLGINILINFIINNV